MSHLVLDIETVPDSALWSAPQDAPDTFAPTWAHQVVAVGGLLFDDQHKPRQLECIKVSPALDREAQLLTRLSALVSRAKATLVTYNGRNFDLPVIALRSMRHGIALRWYYQDRDVRYRYTESGHMDLCDCLTDYGASRSAKLDDVARLIGLPGKCGTDGSSVAAMFSAGRIEQIESYCLSDVAQTGILFLRYLLLRGELTIDAYRSHVEAVLGMSGLNRSGIDDPVLFVRSRAEQEVAA